MVGKKREREEYDIVKKPKKIKFDNTESVETVSRDFTVGNVDFPRGGGTVLTPLEYKSVQNEAAREADMELIFEESKTAKRIKKRRNGETTVASSNASKGMGHKRKWEYGRIEHLNYKRVAEGMKIFCQIIAIHPLSLLVSLPSQLFGHIPVTHISSQLTDRLESMDYQDGDLMNMDEEDEMFSSRPPELFDIFHVGQYVRAVVMSVRSVGLTAGSIGGLGRKLDEMERACQRIELSLIPEKVNSGIVKGDLIPGLALPAAIQSAEDHGYVLDFGIDKFKGFLPFHGGESGQISRCLPVGQVLEVCVLKVAENGRTCNVSADAKMIVTSSMSQVSSLTSILPGMLSSCMVTAVVPGGLHVQVLGYFEGTIDISHIPFSDFMTRYKLGEKVKARVLWDMTTDDTRKFSLSLLPHILDLEVVRMKDAQVLKEAFPIGTILESVKVIRVEPQHGLVVQIQDDIYGYIHIRHVSDDHVPSLAPSSGHRKIGTIHRARVIGYYTLDGVLQLSLQQSVLEKRFLQVEDVEVGEVLKATVKKLTASALFVTLAGNVDGVIWPNHWADITLKRPQQRFREGSTIKCKVLVVDPIRKRIALTAKRTLIDSDLPILSQLDSAHVGMITHGVVYKVVDKGVLVEFYNNLRAQVPVKEASEVPLPNLAEAFPIGKPIKVRLTSIDSNTGRIYASVRGANLTLDAIPDVHAVQVGEVVEGPIKAIHKDQVVLTLEPSGVTALVSLKNIANSRNVTISQLRSALSIGENLTNLVVLFQNPEKGIVIASTQPKAKADLKILPGNEVVIKKSVQVGQLITARVTGYGRGGSTLYVAPGLKGSLHPTDVSDDYDTGITFPAQDTMVKGVIIAIDKSRRYIALSMRPSRLETNVEKFRDPEVNGIEDISVGQTARGFIKSITEHGLFVTLGRNLDARVQIKELFDEFVKDWKSRFKVHQLVKGKITKIMPESNQVEMTFRTAPIQMTLGDFKEGQCVDGVVRKREAYGIFVQIKNTNISGLCHKTEITDNEKADVSQALASFQQGDPVRAKVLTIDLDKKRIAFGLKPSYFSEDVPQSQPEVFEDTSDVPTEDNDSAESLNHQGADSSDDNVINSQQDDYNLEMSNRLGDMELSAQEETLEVAAPVLKIQGGFKWPGIAADEEAYDISTDHTTEEENDDENAPKKSSKKKKKNVEYDLTADLHKRRPESTADFERLLLGSPNSSYLWIQYMSFQLQLSEIDKATEIGKRALATINFREEGEKLNVWIALLNLENKYGTDDSLEMVFRDAVRYNDSKTVHLRMAAIFDESDRHDRVVEQYQRTCKKFGNSSKVWTLFGEYYLKRGQVEAARQLLPRSLLSLEKRKHLKTITKFVQLEYRLGDPERGRTIFEGIVDSHPKRWDLWSIYIDMEATQKNIQAIRNIFDRVLAMKMTGHKAKAFFKKWLELEKRIGDEDGQENVKTKAIEWTRKAVGTA